MALKEFMKRTLSSNFRGSMTLLLFSGCLAFAAAADTWPAADWYVDDDAAAAGANGSREHPYPTIQQAVTAASANQTIFVAEGVYTSGQTLVSGAAYARVYINNKPGLKLLGAGRGKSFIVGSRDPAATAHNDTLTETRTNLVSCIYVRNSADAIIEGFTLRDGEAFYNNSPNQGSSSGGGLYVLSNARDVYLVDCDILHCCARTGGGTYGGTAVRCRFEDNYGMSGVVSRSGVLVNCLIVRNVCDSTYGIMGGAALYNCTMFGNKAKYAFQSVSSGFGNAATNCVIALSSLMTGDLADEFQVASDPAGDSVLASTASKGYVQFIAPGFDDFRLRSDSDAIGAGRAVHLSTLSLPASIDAFKDFTGATIVPDAEGRIHAGAIQATDNSAGGAIVFKGGTYEVDGVTNDCSSIATYVSPVTYPTQYCVRAVLDEGKHLYKINRYDLGTGNAHTNLPAMLPSRDGTMWMMPPPDPSVGVINVMLVAKTVKYVDPNPGIDSDEAAGDADHPYATIQTAMNAADGNTVIYLRPGEYTNDVQTSSRGLFRVYQADNDHYIRIVSTDGPETTIIRGQPDPDFADGLGPKAIKGVFLGRNTVLQGVTIADCYTDNTNATQAAYYNGAAVYGGTNGSTAPSQVIDCIITNCHAVRYAMVNHLVIRRCRLYDCTTREQYVIGPGSASQNGFPLFACYTRGVNNLVAGSGSAGIVGGNARIYQCTFTGTIGSGRLTGTANVSWNSIWYGGKNIYSQSVYTNCFVYKPAGDAIGIYEKTDPIFADVTASGALCVNSPAIGAGGVPAADNFGADYWRYACGDIDGNPIIFDANGHPTLGAFQTPAAVVHVTANAPADGGWAFADSHEFGAFNVADGESVRVTAAEGRACRGVACGDAQFLFADGVGGVATIPYAGLFGGVLEPLYVTEWHVDERNGDDGNSGYTAAEAKKTLATAAALLAKGDTLWVHPGHYTNGVAAHGSADLLVSNRVVVKEGTTVISTDGPEQTFIFGAPATIDPDENGCGTNAMRCAYVEKNARLSGFTLTGGRTHHANPDNTSEDGYGSAVAGFGRSYGCVVENCIISNNYARYGTTFKCDLFGCRVTDNTASIGSAVRQGNAFGCWIDRNYGSPVISYPQLIWNCTLTRGNQVSKTSTSLPMSVANPVDDADIRNSFFGGSVNVTSARSSITYSVVHSNGGTINADVVTNGLIRIDTNTQLFEADGTPKFGANACIDAGNASLNTNVLGNVDLNGFQRLMNGRMDIGCFEADWRGNYAQALAGGRSGFAVTSADPQVVLEDGAPLTVRDGTLAAEWTKTSGKPRRYGCGVAVTDTGTLAVTLNGEPFATVAAADGAQHLEFKNAAALNSLEFTYTPGENDSGWAVLSGLTRESGGLKLNIR